MNGQDFALLNFVAVFFIAIFLTGWWKRLQKKTWAEACSSAVYAGGLILIAGEIYFLGPLLFNGKAGMGGIIILILPIMTFVGTAVAALIVGMIAHAIEFRNPPQIILSPAAQAILNGDPQYIQSTSPRDRSNWKTFAKSRI